jgi:hypothetical protein
MMEMASQKMRLHEIRWNGAASQWRPRRRFTGAAT